MIFHFILTSFYISFHVSKKNTLGENLYYFDTYLNNLSNRPVLSFNKNKFSTNKNIDNIYLTRKDELKKRLDMFMFNKEMGYLIPSGCYYTVHPVVVKQAPLKRLLINYRGTSLT